MFFIFYFLFFYFFYFLFFIFFIFLFFLFFYFFIFFIFYFYFLFFIFYFLFFIFYFFIFIIFHFFIFSFFHFLFFIFYFFTFFIFLMTSSPTHLPTPPSFFLAIPHPPLPSFFPPCLAHPSRTLADAFPTLFRRCSPPIRCHENLRKIWSQVAHDVSLMSFLRFDDVIASGR